VSGKTPELWWPESGRLEPAPSFVEKDGGTTAVLTLGPSDSVFVVFRNSSPVKADPVLSMAREGKLVWSMEKAALRPVVQSARYGVLDNPAQTRDVKDKAQRLVDAGEYSFQVARMAEGDDPAYGIVKKLVMECELDGHRYTVTGTDPETITLPAREGKPVWSMEKVALKPVVRSARYGVLDDPARTRDVKDKAQKLVDAGEYSFQVARMAEGDDPAYGIIKTLVVECELDGYRYTVTGTDPEMIMLLPVVGGDQMIQLRVGADGRLALEASRPGQYELTMVSGQTRKVTVPALPPALDVDGLWELHFPPNWGAPAEVTLPELVSWSEHNDPGVKYFSGTATYHKIIDVPADLIAKGRRLYLDLGNVRVMAEPKLNGKPLGTLWRAPFRVDITDVAKRGRNTLEVKVVNLWPNRMIGDEQMPEDSERNEDGTLKAWPKWVLEGKPSPTGRYTFTSWRLWRKDEPLQPSGLLGPVRIVPTETITLPETSSPAR
jgi:hypothetical protein